MVTNVFLRVPNSTVQITSQDGQMTLPWRRFFQDTTGNLNNFMPPTFGGGPPVTLGTVNGQVYYDTSAVGGYQAYVWNGAWHKVI